MLTPDDTISHNPPRATGSRAEQPLSWRVAALVLVLVATWLPRGTGLDRVVTPDEPLWLARSANFYRALAHGQWDDTYQFVHPGVITMWLGTAGYLLADRSYADEVPGPIDQWHGEIETVLTARDVSPLDVLVAARSMMVLGFTLLCGLGFWFAQRVFGLGTALLGGLFVAFDPFLIAHSRLLHVDAPTAGLLFVSVLALLSYLTTDRRRRDLLAAGVLAGLAVLSRSTGLILIPLTGVMIGVCWWQEQTRRPLKQSWRDLVSPLATWSGAALVTAIALWPALWVHPIRTVVDVVTGAVSAAEEGHGKEIFFAGTIYTDGDPGWHFYPITILWRSTPIVLIGFVLAIGLFVAHRSKRESSQRFGIAALFLFAVAFLVGMSLSAKKFDRYLLPVYPPLDLIAAWGWMTGLAWVGARWNVIQRRWIAVGASALLVLVQVGGAWAARPYYLSAYNPLLGGTKAADSVMMVGWGEGLDQVADYLQTLPKSYRLLIRTGAWPESLSFFVPNSINEDLYTPDRKGALRWATTDLYVWYITPAQRGWLAQDLVAYFDQRIADRTIAIDGLTYARVYDLRTAPLPDYFRTEAAGMTDWDDRIRVVAVRPPYRAVAPGDKAIATVFLEDLTPTDRPLGFRVSLVDSTGNVVAQRGVDLADYRRDRTIWPVKLAIDIPSGTIPGRYGLSVTIYDLATGAPLAPRDSATGSDVASPVTIDQVMIGADEPSTAPVDEDDGVPTSDVQ